MYQLKLYIFHLKYLGRLYSQVEQLNKKLIAILLC